MQKKALYVVIISGEISENCVHKSCMYMLIFDVQANFLFSQCKPVLGAYLAQNVTPLTPKMPEMAAYGPKIAEPPTKTPNRKIIAVYYLQLFTKSDRFQDMAV